MNQGMWEVRTSIDKRIARILFTVNGNKMVLLHGFIKKDKKTPLPDLKLAKDRKKKIGG
jgi:phage-related protein